MFEGGGALSGALIQTHGEEEHSIDSPSFLSSLFVWVVLKFSIRPVGMALCPSFLTFFFFFFFSEIGRREESKSRIHTSNMRFKLKIIWKHSKDMFVSYI